MYSGRVLFNDPITAYLNQIADKLLQSNPKLRSEIRIYAVKSASVNAFTTNDGIVFVNLGLLSQMENESQIAYVLAHEIIHYQKKHAISGYVEAEKVTRGKGVYKELSFDDKILAKNSYSKELETEADLEGLELYSKSEYSLNEIAGVFDVLQYAYLPFDEVKFEKSFFELENFILPEEYLAEKINPIGSLEDEYSNDKNEQSKSEDSRNGKAPSKSENSDGNRQSKSGDYSTHPSTAKRKAAILSRISGLSNQDKKKYLVSEETFMKIRKIARFEISSIYLLNRQYAETIYHSYLLLKEDSSSIYLRKNVAKSLYALSRYFNENQLDEVLEKSSSIEGESQQVYHIIEKMPKNELNILALKYTWKLHQEIKDTDNDLEYVIRDLLYNLTKYHYPKRSAFFTNPPSNDSSNKTDNDNTQNKELSKIDKIKKSKIENAENNAILYALINELKNQEFIELYDKMAAIDKEKKKEKSYKETAKEEKRKRVKGEHLGIDKIVLVNPLYSKLNLKKEDAYRYVDSEESQVSLNKLILKNAKKVGLEIELLAKNNFKENEGEMFDDFAVLNGWLSEKFTEADNKTFLVNLEEEKINELVKKYNTPYFCWTGFVGAKVKKAPNSVLFTAVMSLLFPPIYVITLPLMIAPKYESAYLCLLFNVQTGELVFEQLVEMRTKDSPAILN